MSELMYYGILIILVFGAFIGIALMSRVPKAALGNMILAGCTGIAIILTMYRYGLLSAADVWIFLGLGFVIGLVGAYRIKMIQMPQAVSMLNGFGGAASAFIAIVIFFSGDISAFEIVAACLALIIGVPTLTGSLVAAGKLHNIMSQKPVVWAYHQQLTIIPLLLMLIFVVAMPFIFPANLLIIVTAMVLLSGFFGVGFAIRIGGADMPIAISLINSCSGLAVSAAGMAVGDPLLVAIGAVVGAAGLILTQIMCKSMNSSLIKILMGKTSVSEASVPEEPEAAPQNISEKSPQNIPEKTPQSILAEAKSVIIVPGYGMALAQAQSLVKQLADKLETNGTDVKYAIHPVAGRMPGHMNVLLAEVDVPYDKLFEIDDINPMFADCDAVVIVGANDVVNPAAKTAEGTPIYGMPILDVEDAKNIIVCNFDLQPGYAGVPNPLYENNKSILLLGDAKESIGKLMD